MVFSELLKQIVNKVEGAVGVLIMGLDGIAIEQQIENTANYDGQLSIIAAAYATLR